MQQYRIKHMYSLMQDYLTDKLTDIENQLTLYKFHPVQ